MTRKIRLPFLPLASVLLAVIGTVSSASAQPSTIRRIADLNPGDAGSFPTNLTILAGSLDFSAYTLDTGRELWSYNGTSINLVSNINDTVVDIGFGVLEGNDSSPAGLTGINGILYFSAFDPRRGGELWRYDGAVASRVADINPDANDIIKTNANSSWPNELSRLGNELYFSANGGGILENYELWKYDGVSTVLVSNIHPNIGANHSSFPKGLTAFNGTVYFMADDGANGFELWKAGPTGAAQEQRLGALLPQAFRLR